MAGLVSYESSDEDEVVEAPKEQVNTAAPTHSNTFNLIIMLTNSPETKW